MSKTVVFRADSSVQIGTGHIMRCLTLAETIADRGHRVIFICRRQPGDMISYVRQKGYEAAILNPAQDVEPGQEWRLDAEETICRLSAKNLRIDWLIVDHYGLGLSWEAALRPNAKKIMVIDDLANRKHDCDILLDQNYYIAMESRYNHLLPPYCRQMLGPQYALLRNEFYRARLKLRNRGGTVRRILVFYGGSDPTCETEKTMEALAKLPLPHTNIDVVVGAANQRKEKIQSICRLQPNTIFHFQVENMAELMAEADLAIGAGGSATWERCLLGLPALVIVVADNQAEVAKAVADKGAIINLGQAKEVTTENLLKVLAEVVQNPELLARMSQKAFELMGPQPVKGADLIWGTMEEVYAETQ